MYLNCFFFIFVVQINQIPIIDAILNTCTKYGKNLEIYKQSSKSFLSNEPELRIFFKTTSLRDHDFFIVLGVKKVKNVRYLSIPSTQPTFVRSPLSILNHQTKESVLFFCAT